MWCGWRFFFLCCRLSWLGVFSRLASVLSELRQDMRLCCLCLGLHLRYCMAAALGYFPPECWLRHVAVAVLLVDRQYSHVVQARQITDDQRLTAGYINFQKGAAVPPQCICADLSWYSSEHAVYALVSHA